MSAPRVGGRRVGAFEHGAHEEVRLECGNGVLHPCGAQGLRASLQGLHQTGRVDTPQHRVHTGHTVGQGRHRDVPGAGRALGTIAGSLRLQLLDHALEVRPQLTVTLPGQEQRVLADHLVDGCAGLRIRGGERARHGDSLTDRKPPVPEPAEGARQVLHQSASRREGEGRRRRGDPAGDPDLGGGTLPLDGGRGSFTAVCLTDLLLGADLPGGLDGGQRRSQMIESAEDRERLLRRVRRRGGQGVPDGGGPGEGLQRGREDLGEKGPGSGTRVEGGDMGGDVAQEIAGRRSIARSGLFVVLVSCGSLIHFSSVDVPASRVKCSSENVDDARDVDDVVDKGGVWRKGGGVIAS